MHNHSLLARFRTAFLSGIVLLAPLAVTIWVINTLIQALGALVSPVFRTLLPEDLLDKFWINWTINLVSAALVVLLIALIGWLSRFFLGKMIFNQVEKMLQNLPIIKIVYGTVRQIIDTISQQQKAVFQQAVLVQFPRPGLYSLGFLTSTASGEVQIKTQEKVVNVFIPTTPNPTSGYLVMVPENDVMVLDMNIGDAMKLIISGGSVVPKYRENGTLTAEVTAPPPG